jgi:hypothetical protein
MIFQDILTSIFDEGLRVSLFDLRGINESLNTQSGCVAGPVYVNIVQLPRGQSHDKKPTGVHKFREIVLSSSPLRPVDRRSSDPPLVGVAPLALLEMTSLCRPG